MTVLQNDADVGWYVENLAYNAGKISGLLISRIVFVYFFSKLVTLCNKKKKIVYSRVLTEIS